MIYFVPFSNIITISLPGFSSVQSALVGPVDEQQGRLQKRYDPRERGPHSFYLLGQYNCLRESERWLDWLCVHVILWFFCFFSFSVWRGSLSDTLQQRVSMHHHQGSSEGGTLSQTGRSWLHRANSGGTVCPGAHAVSDITNLWLLQTEGKSVFINLRVSSVLSVYLPQLTLCWSKWFW